MAKTEQGRQGGKAPRAAERIGVLVLGMHRSGTSALARVLSLLGCDLPKALMEANPTNEAGHWESLPICRLNDEILSSAGSNWHDWLAFNPGWHSSPKAIEYKEKALAVLEEEFGHSSLFVLKDPRICRIAPFWLDVLESAGVRPAILLPVRNPLEVADSLSRRNDFDPALGHLLWLRHVLEAEAGTRGRLRFHSSYDGLLKGWPRLAAGAEQKLDISWPRFSPLVSEEIDAFLTERLRHHRESPKSVADNPQLSAWLRETFAILGRWAEQGEAEADHAALDRIHAELDTAAPAFARIISTGQQAARKAKILDASLKETQGKLTETEAAATAKQQQVEELERGLGEVRTALAASQDSAAEREREIAGATERLAAARAELAAMQGEAETLRSALDEARGELATMHSALAQRRAEADDAVAQLRQAEERHADELEAERARLPTRLDEIASLTRLLREKEEAAERRVAEADEARRKEAERAERLAGEFEAERSRAGAEMKKLRQEKGAAEGRLAERFSEIAVMTKLLSEKESAAEQAEWLREVSAVLMNGAGSTSLKGRLAALLPASIRLQNQKARLKKTGIFDPDAYLAANPDVAEAGIDPLRHYINHGIGEGRQLQSTLPAGEQE